MVGSSTLLPGGRILHLLKPLRVVFIALGLSLSLHAQLTATTATTAWRHGIFHVNVGHVVSESDIVLGRPNTDPTEALPLGNGRLGAAVWSANGMTIQLNRADTLPHRLSPGQIIIPGLARLTSARDYQGRLDLYSGAFAERGGGVSATVYIQPQSDTLVIDVTGVDPAQPQTATLQLWEPRTPKSIAQRSVGILQESWLDDQDPGASGSRFGSLAAITAEGRDVTASVAKNKAITVTFKPKADGSFRLFVAAPHYAGSASAAAIVAPALANRDPAAHVAWWHAFWQRAGLIQASSPDGEAQYMTNLRNIYLFSAAAENGDRFPGSQAGVADLFSSARDDHRWDPAAYWHWNLRMQVAANLSAGLPQLNLPYFRLYRENLSAIQNWTRERMNGGAGTCVPETMRFNGNGVEYQTWTQPTGKPSGLNCDANSTPYYNARTLSTGAEVSQWIWQQYLITGDRAFLGQNFPVMTDSARFLLACEKPGPDGLHHTSPSNAHETQWDVTDPTTDLAAREALYNATINAAKALGAEPALQRQLEAALTKIPALPRTQASGGLTLLPAGADHDGHDVIANSYQPDAHIHNSENVGLEPVWPYATISDTSPLFALAQRTYEFRPNKEVNDWSFDPVQAARLHLGSEVADSLRKITETSQRFINGFAHLGPTDQDGEFYVEQTGVVAATLAESLVQDYDGTLRIAPAIPPGWNFDGSVFVQGGTKVDVQVRNGTVTTLGLEVHHAQSIRLRNPWPGSTLRVKDAQSGREIPITSAANSPEIAFAASAGHCFLIERVAQPSLPFATIDGKPAARYRRLNSVQIGLPGN
jgi:glycosyl hydrolase family 95